MATAKPVTKHTTNRRAFAPRLFPIRITPFLHGVKREWLTACLQQTTAGSFPAFFIIRAVSIYVNVFHASPGISRSFSPVLARKISSQYQTSTTRFLTCAKDRATPGLPRSLVLSPTSTPKPRAEGRWPPVALCRAGLGSRLLFTDNKPFRLLELFLQKYCLTFWEHFTLRFCRFSFCTCCMGMGFTLVQTLGFPIRSHLFPTAATPSSTQNAPDFSYFRLKSGAFRCFCLLLTCKNFVPVFLRHPGFPAIHIDSF